MMTQLQKRKSANCRSGSGILPAYHIGIDARGRARSPGYHGGVLEWFTIPPLVSALLLSLWHAIGGPPRVFPCGTVDDRHGLDSLLLLVAMGVASVWIARVVARRT